MFLLHFIWKKMGWGQPVTGGILGFFLGVLIGFLILFTTPRAYVLFEDESYNQYLVFVETEYETKQDSVVVVPKETGKCFVINESDQVYIIEEQVYGGYGFSGDTKWIKPGKAYHLDFDRIFYFFEDKPPGSIRIKSKEPVKRYWLRRKRG